MGLVTTTMFETPEPRKKSQKVTHSNAYGREAFELSLLEFQADCHLPDSFVELPSLYLFLANFADFQHFVMPK